MEVTVEVRTVYGNQLIYPINYAAQLFAAIAGSKTLSAEHCRHITALGHTVRRVVPAVDFASTVVLPVRKAHAADLHAVEREAL